VHPRARGDERDAVWNNYRIIGIGHASESVRKSKGMSDRVSDEDFSYIHAQVRRFIRHDVGGALVRDQRAARPGPQA
jgi:hypothetical protein